MLLAIYDYPLTIVEAPMGFGKTTAVRDFFVSDKNPPLWIAFLNSDDSTSFIWNSIAAEVGKLNDEAGIRLKSLGLSVDAPQRARVLAMLNDLDFKKKTVFVIDDYHLSENLQVNKLFKQIVMERLDNLHIVIITRDTSNFDFAGLFAKGMRQVISQQHLKLSKEEIRAYASMMDENIAESDIEKISEYTDGWISLIYMVLLGLTKGIPVGMNKTIDELIENVLFNAYGEHIQKFLLKLSIMDNFTAKQAWFVAQEEKTNEFLEKLHHRKRLCFL
jgi:LuxR family maltose regulon positive regulatory protein